MLNSAKNSFLRLRSLVLPHMVYFGRRNQEGHIDGSMAVGLALTQTVSVLPENELIGSQVDFLECHSGVVWFMNRLSSVWLKLLRYWVGSMMQT